MATFNFGIDLVKLGASEQEQKTIQARGGSKFIFENLFNSLLTNKFPQGVQGPRLRILSRLMDKIDLATDTTEIEIEAAEADLLREIFTGEDVQVMPQQVRLYAHYQNLVEKLG